jgi:3-oxoacyl-[acyl-carrier protein] reductase
MGFRNKKVVITGAGGIYGGWITRAFAREGARLCLSDIRSDALNRIALDPDVVDAVDLTHFTDLRNPDSMAVLEQTVSEAWGAPDILINNAGVYPSHKLLEMSREVWDSVLDINLSAPFELIKIFSRQMIRHGVQGSIVNMTSASAMRPRIGAGHYAVSKAGLSMLTRAFALELAPYNIRVNAVSPGLAIGSEVSELSESYVQAMAEVIPLGRLSGPNDAPQVILFLCSDSAAYVTGATYVVDGGGSAGAFRLPTSDGK